MTSVKQHLKRTEITFAHVESFESHGNPQVRRAARILRRMVDRHAKGEYNTAMDMETIDDANYCLPVAMMLDFD